MLREYIETALSASLEKLIRLDSDILLIDVNERSISHRLAVYLEEHFTDWNVDCEYNRHNANPKRLNIQGRNTRSDDIEAITVFPDIIIHHRNTDDNLVVIEMKKSTSSENEEYDIRKLRAFKSELNYQFAIFIRVKTNGDSGIEIRWL